MLTLDSVLDAVEALVTRGVLAAVNVAKKMHTLQVDRVAGLATSDHEVEHFEPFGLATHPHKGAEVLLLNQGGDLDLPVAVAVADRRYQPTDALGEGDVALYNDAGREVLLQGPNVYLGERTGALGVARNGDEVTVILAPGDLGNDGTGAPIPQLPVTLKGSISSASTTVFSK